MTTSDSHSPSRTRQGEFRIGFLVHDVSRVRRTLFDSHIKHLSLTRSRWWALVQLSRTLNRDDDRGMTQTELADKMEVAKVTVGGLIDHLEASGLVQRRADPNDRRTNRIVVTELGYATLVEMSEVGHRLNVAALADIPEEHVQIAEQVLSRMKTNIIALLGNTDFEVEPDVDAEIDAAGLAPTLDKSNGIAPKNTRSSR